MVHEAPLPEDGPVEKLPLDSDMLVHLKIQSPDPRGSSWQCRLLLRML